MTDRLLFDYDDEYAEAQAAIIDGLMDASDAEFEESFTSELSEEVVGEFRDLAIAIA